MVDLDTRLLRAFVTVAEELNFTRAAERLVLAQQALSAQVRQLESRLGARLFERTTRRVRLTEAGDLLLPHARAVIQALDAGTQELAAAQRVAGAVLRVGLSGTATVPLTSETMRRFSEGHPEVRLAVSNAGLDRPAAGLHEGAVDVAFVRPPFRDEGLSMVTVLTEERFAVLPEGHPLASRDEVRPEDVVGEPWIWVEGGDPVARAFWSLEEHRGGRPLQTGTRVNSFEEAFGAVAAGLAITCQADWVPASRSCACPAGRRAAGTRRGRLAHRARDRSGPRVRAHRARGRLRRCARLTTEAGGWPGESVFHIRPARSQSRRCQPTEGRTSVTTIDSLSTDGYLTHQGEPWWFGGTMFEFLVPSDSTGGQITVFRYTAPGGFGPPRHVHTREDEVFHVLDGHVAFEIDGRRQVAGPGTTVWMPRGVPHGFRIESPVAVILGLMTPGQYEHLFRDLGVPAAERRLPGPDAPALDVGALVAEMTARGTEVVGPPMAAA